MAKSVFLETEHLRIAPFDEEHLTDRYVGWLNDPEVTRFSEQRHRHHTLASCRAYFEAMYKADHPFLAICDKTSGLHIGNASVTVDAANGIADVAIMIGDRAYWGQHLGAEAFTTLVEAMLRREGIRKVTAGTMAANRPMLKAVAAAGMTEDGRRRDHYILHGKPMDLVYFARWRADG